VVHFSTGLDSYVSRLALDGCVQEMGPNHGSFATSALVSPFEWQNPEPLIGAPNARTQRLLGFSEWS